MADAIRVTIGIACFNAEETIERAVQSALAQAWADLEVLVVDDASTDTSVERIEDLARKDRRVRLLRQAQNTGVGAVRQRIVDEATGELIAFFDDDDYSEANRIPVQVDRILDFEARQGHRRVACFASGRRIYPNGYVFDLPAIASHGPAIRGKALADYLLFNRRESGFFYGAGTPACALMAAATVIKAAGGFDPSLRRVEDSDFAIRLALKDGYFIGCEERLFTQKATKASDKTAKANYRAESQLIEKHKDYLLAKRRYSYAKNWFRFRYLHFSGRRLKALAALLFCWLRNPILTTRQFLHAAPRRLRHERKMGAFSQNR